MGLVKNLISWGVETLASRSSGLRRIKRRGKSDIYSNERRQQTGRQELYRRGGIFSVTSQILIVDMLQSTLPTEMITGFMILHAERSDLGPPRGGGQSNPRILECQLYHKKPSSSVCYAKRTRLLL